MDLIIISLTINLFSLHDLAEKLLSWCWTTITHSSHFTNNGEPRLYGNWETELHHKKLTQLKQLLENQCLQLSGHTCSSPLIFPHTFVFHENTFFINSSDEVTSLSWKVGDVRYNKNISVLVTKTLVSCLCSSTFTL